MIVFLVLARQIEFRSIWRNQLQTLTCLLSVLWTSLFVHSLAQEQSPPFSFLFRGKKSCCRLLLIGSETRDAADKHAREGLQVMALNKETEWLKPGAPDSNSNNRLQDKMLSILPFEDEESIMLSSSLMNEVPRQESLPNRTFAASFLCHPKPNSCDCRGQI